MLKITVKKNTMTPHLRALLKAHSGNGAVMPMLGRAAANLLRSHSCAKDNTPNKLRKQLTTRRHFLLATRLRRHLTTTLERSN